MYIYLPSASGTPSSPISFASNTGIGLWVLCSYNSPSVLVSYPTGGNIQIRFDLGEEAFINLTGNASLSPSGSGGMQAGIGQRIWIYNSTSSPVTLSIPSSWKTGTSPGIPPSIPPYALWLLELSCQSNTESSIYASFQLPPSAFAPAGFSGNLVAIAKTWSQMKALSPSGWADGSVVMLLGYYSRDDGGGGAFEWNASDTTADNGGTVMQLTGVSTGRLHRIAASSIASSGNSDTTLDVRWFGAIPGSGQDCTPGFAAAYSVFNFSGSYDGTIYAPSGTYLFMTTWTVNGSSTAHQSITIKGDGKFSTIFFFDFPSNTTDMWLLENLPLSVYIRDCSFRYSGTSVSVTTGAHLHVKNVPYLDILNVAGQGLNGNFIKIESVGWISCLNVLSSIYAGVSIWVNGAGGVIDQFNLGSSGGRNAPGLLIQNCNSLSIGRGEVSSCGPYKGATGCSLASSPSSFTVTYNNHGFSAGDYVFISAASSHSGWVGLYKIASTTTNTITCNSTLNLGNDTVTADSIWSNIYFGGAGSTTSSLCTESSIGPGIICNNNASGTVPGYCGMFFDGWSNGTVTGIRVSDFDLDAGFCKLFLHGKTSIGGINAFLYSVATSTSGYISVVTAQSSINAGSFVTGTQYVIQTVGTTNFTSIGAPNNNVGTVFTATGSGSGSGTACPTVNHGMLAGQWVYIPGFAGGNWFQITWTNSYSFRFLSSANPGPTITVPVYVESAASTVNGILMSKLTAASAVNNTFGAIRVEGCNSIEIDNCQVELGAGNIGSSYSSAGLVISDGAQQYPSIDIRVNGGSYSSNDQSVISPYLNPLPITLDGPLLFNVSLRGVVCTGVPPGSVFNLTNGFNVSNLDSDMFSGQMTFLQLLNGYYSVPNGSQVPINFDTPAIDELSMWDPANPGRLTPPIGVKKVRLSGSVTWQNSSFNWFISLVRFNSSGSNYPNSCGAAIPPNQPFNNQYSISWDYECLPGDYFELQVLQTSGSSQNIAPSDGTNLVITVIK